MLDHMIIPVADLDVSKAFYEKALDPLGGSLIADFAEQGGLLGFGRDGMPSFWIRQGEVADPAHVAFQAGDSDTVDAFHAAALAAGGKDNGEPGKREIYHPHYYGAFVLDPDGHNVEAVIHDYSG
jgi:catechol 2,3-dioxygenase-like lactoylglutathione lyase family enzyme